MSPARTALRSRPSTAAITEAAALHRARHAAPADRRRDRERHDARRLAQGASYNLRSRVSTWIFGIAFRRALKALKRLDDPMEFDPDECPAAGTAGRRAAAAAGTAGEDRSCAERTVARTSRRARALLFRGSVFRGDRRNHGVSGQHGEDADVPCPAAAQDPDGGSRRGRGHDRTGSEVRRFGASGRRWSCRGSSMARSEVTSGRRSSSIFANARAAAVKSTGCIRCMRLRRRGGRHGRDGGASPVAPANRGIPRRGRIARA